MLIACSFSFGVTKKKKIWAKSPPDASPQSFEKNLLRFFCQVDKIKAAKAQQLMWCVLITCVGLYFYHPLPHHEAWGSVEQILRPITEPVGQTEVKHTCVQMEIWIMSAVNAILLEPEAVGFLGVIWRRWTLGPHEVQRQATGRTLEHSNRLIITDFSPSALIIHPLSSPTSDFHTFYCLPWVSPFCPGRSTRYF